MPARAGGERAQGLVDDGPPRTRPSRDRADQVDAVPGDPNRLAVGIDAEDVVGVAAGSSLRMECSRAVASQGAAVRRGDQSETPEPEQRPSLPGKRTIPEDLALRARGRAATAIAAPGSTRPRRRAIPRVPRSRAADRSGRR